AFIRMSQRLGIPLARIREAMATLPADRTPTSKDWARLSAAWRADLDERIVHLQRLRDNLTGCIGCGCLSLKVCALANPGDALAEEGPGAVRL
ncbi:MAG: redox-sensitive transcriptional activator SoxR, partial [Mycobacterium sp.]|nr:redox-sensitive transcriptional activator SoxR [Mycobacterium sp.]